MNMVRSSAKVMTASTSPSSSDMLASTFLAKQGPMKTVRVSGPCMVRTTRAMATMGDTTGARWSTRVGQ